MSHIYVGAICNIYVVLVRDVSQEDKYNKWTFSSFLKIESLSLECKVYFSS